MDYINKVPLDKNNKPHGEWILYYSNGQLSYNHNYFHGILHGLAQSYFIDGDLHYKGYYSIGRSIGYWITSKGENFYLCLI